MIVIKFLYNNVKTFIVDDKPYILTRGRKSDGARVNVIFYGFRPRFFVKDDDLEKVKDIASIHPRIVTTFKSKNIKKSIFWDDVSVVVTLIPKDVRDSHSNNKWEKRKKGVTSTVFKGMETFMSEIPFEITFLIWTKVKSGIEIPDEPDKYIMGIPAYNWKRIKPFDDYDTESKVNFLDIETYYFKGDNFDPEKAETPITIISTKNNYTKEITGFCCLPNKTIKEEEYVDEWIGATKNKYGRKIFFYDGESDMLRGFIDFFIEIDPDILTAWNTKYDFGYIINRCNKIGVDCNRLSPWNKLFDKPVMTSAKNIPIIFGRDIMDSINVYRERTKFSGEKHFYSLDSVAKDVVGIGKVEKKDKNGKKITTGQMTDDPELLLEYNFRDTELVELIGNVKTLWTYVEKLRRMLGVPIAKVFSESISMHSLFVRHAMDMGMCFQNRDFKRARKYTFKGGKVFDPKPGLYRGVVGFDFKSLYANIIVMFNISPETRIRDPKKYDKEYLDKCIKTPTGLYFKQYSEQEGILPTIVKGLMKEGDRIKEKYLKAFDKYGSKDPYVEGLDEMYSAIKAIRNTVYGVMKFYLIEIADCITAIARLGITEASRYSESKELKEDMINKFENFKEIIRIYGDTDSCYLYGIDPFDEYMMEYVGKKCSNHLGTICKKFNVKENLFIFRAEDSYSSFFLQEAKKKYSGIKVRSYKETVKGGEWRKINNKFVMVGHEKSDISIYGNECFSNLQEQICLSALHDFDIRNYTRSLMNEAKKNIYNRKIPLYKLCPSKKAERDFDTYGGTKKDGSRKGVPIHITAAICSNNHLGTRFVRKDKIPYLYVKCKFSYVIALPDDWTYEELKEHKIYIDVRRIYDKEIRTKFKPPLRVLGYNIEDIESGKKQMTLR